MTHLDTGRLAMAGCLAFLIFLLVPGCNDEVGPGGGTGGAAGGSAGSGGMAGMGGTEPPPPQLWEGQSNGVDVCFTVSGDGLRLTTEPGCSLGGQGGQGGQATGPSFEIDVRLGGTDQIGQPCSFELSYQSDITIDQGTQTFQGSFTEAPGSGITLSFSGELVGQTASGIAQRDEGDSYCRAGWAASTSNECDDAAIEACLDLQDCCRAILVNPVFFEACNSIVLQCDERQCREVLDGYSQCATEP